MNVNKIEISERTLSVIAFGLAIGAFITALWSMHEAEVQRIVVNREIDRLVHQVNIMTVITQDHDALMYRAGIKQPGDMAKGPTGNLVYNPKE